MKTLKKYKTIIFLLAVCLLTNNLLAQSNQNEMVEKRESREARKIGFFTSKMQLTTDESQIFWPLVNEMEAELKELRKKNSDKSMMLKGKGEISDKELEEIMDAKMEMGKSQMDIKIKYHKKFKEVLPIKKVAKYYEATQEYRKILAKRKANKSEKYR
tara:strand:+ start:2002 stop:2475 length:474 start_codon:yes stop_codon:yes gene_type:complete